MKANCVDVVENEKMSQPLRCSAHPVTPHINSFLTDKLATLKSALKCSGRSSGLPVFGLPASVAPLVRSTLILAVAQQSDT